jgi:hypothetical protein
MQGGRRAVDFLADFYYAWLLIEFSSFSFMAIFLVGGWEMRDFVSRNLYGFF